MTLYPYQERVKKLLFSGKSVILQAPTGSGKTRAALAPFIEAFFDHPPEFFPRKCIYSVPMKVLANQFLTEYDKRTEKYRRIHRREMTVSIQTGDRPDDAKFESNLIFATIDQTLSNYLSAPYAVGKRLANINAGAVLSSYLVFDELHLYDPDSTFPTTLAMLRELKDITPFIVMTATFSSQMLDRLANLLGAVVVPEKQEDRISMESIGSQMGKDRRFYPVDAPLTAEAVLAQDAVRTVCICNTVARSQQLYVDLKTKIDAQEDEDVELTLLHSRFYKDHRDEKEKQIKECFGTSQKEYKGSKRILIATQVVEVGLDITCDIMHTEIAPASSILQRSGRCARKANEQGKIYVYLPRNEDGEPDFVPYYLPPRKKGDDKKRPAPPKTERGLRLCQATWDVFSADEFSDVHMNFRREQALIDKVHKPVDKEILDSISAASGTHLAEMEKVMRKCDRGQAVPLIREVHSAIFATLHSNPDADENIIRNPWYYDGFSLTAGQLYRVLKQLEEGEIRFDGWPMYWAQRSGEFAEGQAYSKPDYTWTEVREAGEVYGKPIIAIDPRFIHYSKEMGLWLDERGEKREPKKRSNQKRPFSKYLYERETFTEHVRGLYNAYIYPQEDSARNVCLLPLKEEVEFATQRLEQLLGLTQGTLDTMLRTLFAVHDLGKLDTRWQAWAHNWQANVGQFFNGQNLSIEDDYFAAHTDYDSGDKEQQKAQRKIRPKRPNHAGESAIAGFEILEEICDMNEDLWKAGFTAIVRHHSPLASSYKTYSLDSNSKDEISNALDAAQLPSGFVQHLKYKDDGNQEISLGIIQFSHPNQYLLYFFLVRILRLADQRSQQK